MDRVFQFSESEAPASDPATSRLLVVRPCRGECDSDELYLLSLAAVSGMARTSQTETPLTATSLRLASQVLLVRTFLPVGRLQVKIKFPRLGQRWRTRTRTRRHRASDFNLKLAAGPPSP
jgi:hypothetical protein